MSTCTKCLTHKPLDKFLIRSDTGKPTSHCRECRNAISRERYKDPKVKSLFRNRALKSTHGISLDDYNDMFDSQLGCCKTCKRHQTELSKGLVVDHCHKTGQIRGLLCDYCNRLLGNYENKPELFESFDIYLNQSKIRLVKEA